MARSFASLFNLRQNFSDLIRRPEVSHFTAIDGLRAISILWMISFHTLWGLGNFLPADQFDNIFHRPELFVFWQGPFSLDIFFVISGFLIGYYLLSEFRSHHHIDLKRFYFRRALRLLPGYYAGLIVFSLLIGKNVGNVWANLVYVNNFLPYSKQCMEWAWSLAIEEQFYICLPLLLPLILKSPVRPLGILFSAFVASFLIQYAVISHYGLTLPVPMHPLMNAQGFWQYFDVAYDKIYMRYGALLIGVVCAYLYVHTKVIERMNRGWIPFLLVGAGFLTMAAGVFMLVLTGIPKWPITAGHWLLASCHNVFSLGAGLVCLFVLTTKGAQSLMGRFLSARFFYAIAQVSYGAYLLHLTLILVLYKHLLPGIEPSDSNIASYIAFYEVVTLTGATLMYVCIERPFIKLRSLLKEVR